jgi:ribosomal protein S18 acetylase RimI-like enzyme
MSESSFMPDIKLLVPDDWWLLRQIRLTALQESPESFLAQYDEELTFSQDRWRFEFDRGDWYVGFRQKNAMSMVGCTREKATPQSECFIEYLWVDPDARGSGVAFHLLTNIIERLQVAGVRRAFLWIMDGNDRAERLYSRVGFVSSKIRQPLTARPGRSEELMQYDRG